jgi:Na+-driven multidrug efflux pump
LGYSTGSAPVFSFNYGCENIKMLKRIFKISIKFVVVASVATFVLSLVLADELVLVFAKPNTNVYDLSIEGFYLFSSSFLFAGINIFSSAMFTAFSDGRVSAIISFSRTFLFIVVALLVLPLIMGITGIWIAIPVAEFLGIIVSVFYFIKCRKKYSYV